MDKNLIEQARNAVELTNWRIHMIIPSVLAPGERFSLRMTAFGPDDLPSSAFKRSIVFTDSPCIEGLPKSVSFSESSNGCLLIEDLKATTPGNAYIAALPEGAPAQIYSNPCWVEKDPSTRVYWGDIHIHTTFSNCSDWACKSPEFAYAYARDASYLDFAAAADHLRGIVSDEARWPRLQELAQKYNEAGTFAVFLGFESSHKTGFGGDNNVYFLEDDAPYFWADRKDMKGTQPKVPLDTLWKFLDKTGKNYITIPHHTGRAGKYRDFSDPVYSQQHEPVFEIYSMWGSSESRWNRFPLYAGNSDEPCYFRDALIHGYRYGVIASSDDHTTMVGSQTHARTPLGIKNLGNYPQRGLTAIRTDSLTRTSLWEGLRRRSCWATTFSRTLLNVSIGDVSMGEEVIITKKDPLRKKRNIAVNVHATDYRNTRAVFIRNGEEIGALPLTDSADCVIFKDQENLEDCAIRDSHFHPEPFVVYYVRIENLVDQTQWSSPIWLDLE